MLIFLAYESATTPLCLSSFKCTGGFCPCIVGGKISPKLCKPPVDILIGNKCKALADGEAENNAVSPVMTESCWPPCPLPAGWTGDTS